MSTERADAHEPAKKQKEPQRKAGREHPPATERPGRRTTSVRGEDIVTEASEESFPASDPPAWTGTITGSPPDD